MRGKRTKIHDANLLVLWNQRIGRMPLKAVSQWGAGLRRNRFALHPASMSYLKYFWNQDPNGSFILLSPVPVP